MPSLRIVALGALVAVAGAAASASAATPVLNAKVGGGSDGNAFTITLTQGGKKVTTLKAGKYAFKVSDIATIHNFRISGPGGINKATSVPAKQAPTWNLTLKKGTYKFVCDPHLTSMKGSFKVT